MTLVRITLLSLLCAALTTLGCSATRAPTECQSASQCPSGSRCNSGMCRAAARPVAALSPMPDVATYALVSLDGSASHDPDGGAIVSHQWNIAAVDATCEVPIVASTDPFARVRFGCAGDYAVSLVVRNDLGFESETVTTTVRAVASADGAAISTGPDLGTEHVCTGSPLRCTTADDVTLAATSSNPVLSLRWSVLPPAGRPLSDARRVHFDPDVTATAPKVTIETDGVAISGDWVFRVEARDEYGAVGSAIQRVSVKNRKPVITIAQPTAPFNHGFDAEHSMFTAEGAVDYQVSDPDGDPLQLDSIARHVGDGGARFDVRLTTRGVASSGLVPVAAFTVEVPYADPADALKLVGASGLERSIELVARDVNGEETRGTAQITIGNRPPVPSSAPTSISVPHRFDAANQRYVATPAFGEWKDPDGDPVFPIGGAPPCTLSLDPADGIVRANCAVPYVGVPAVDQIVGQRRVVVRVRDPWGEASAPVEYTVDIQNSAPVLTFVNEPAERTVWFRCGPYAVSQWLEGMYIKTTPTVVDADGDPVILRAILQASGEANPLEQTCLGGACTPIVFYEPGHTVTYGSTGNPWGYNSLVVSDGAASPAWEVSPTVWRRCR